MSRPDFGVGLFLRNKKCRKCIYIFIINRTYSPQKYLTKDYITCLDYAFMSSNTIICDVVSKIGYFPKKMRVLILKP